MIVCLGWGSLIWNHKGLPAQGGWNTDGPQLPVEYTRVSGGGRLTLVVTTGAPPITAFWSRLSVGSVDHAIEALAGREGCAQAAIGFWAGEQMSTHVHATDIGGWAEERGYVAVVWTALKPGFPDSRGTPLTCGQAIAHLRTLEGEMRVDAEEYVRRTPIQVRTPYRCARQLFWPTYWTSIRLCWCSTGPGTRVRRHGVTDVHNG